MKAREQRVNVLIPARIRWNGQWMPASIRNVSTRGMLLRMPAPPGPGTYVEISAGGIDIAARAMWSAGESCGLYSRERFDLANLRARAKPQLQVSATPVRPRATTTQSSEADREARSRQLASLFQYVTFAAVAVVAASSLAWEVYHVLAAPMRTIEEKMAVGGN